MKNYNLSAFILTIVLMANFISCSNEVRFEGGNEGAGSANTNQGTVGNNGPGTNPPGGENPEEPEFDDLCERPNVEMEKVYKVKTAYNDRYSQFPDGHAIILDGIGRFISQPNSRFYEYKDGSALLVGNFLGRLNTTLRACIKYVRKNDQGLPKKELKEEAYSENQGPVKTEFWSYYEFAHGALHFGGDLKGAVIELKQRGPDYQVGYGANGKNISMGGSGWLDYKVVGKVSLLEDRIPLRGVGDINIDLEAQLNVMQADSDKRVALYDGGHAIFFFGRNFKFIFQPHGTLEMKNDGSAVMKGRAVHADNPRASFMVELNFTGFSLTAPEGSPKIELKPEAYTRAGGVINPQSWVYYERMSGTFIGEDQLSGLNLEISRRGPAPQIGQGASGKNLNFGGSGWFDYRAITVEERHAFSIEGHGDFNIDLY
jgi:hypothetical protein